MPRAPSTLVHDHVADGLILRAQQGDPTALKELCERYVDRVYGYAVAMLRDRDQADDITQQVFERAIGALPSYVVEDGRPFASWLLTITRNAAARHLRENGRERPRDPADIDAADDRTADEDLLEKLSWITNADLFLFVQRLPRAQVEVVVLRHLQGMPFEDIAVMIGRSPKAARRLHERATATLRARLTAIGRTPARGRRAPMRVRRKPAFVMAARRFVLGGTAWSAPASPRPAPAAYRQARRLY